ncbi:hypothetical protein [Neolewinella sp.]|uniref:hypothetical protein n=1 Tax=Neolewinella sp. TaxID=2993543 RepID=UPI003B51A533
MTMRLYHLLLVLPLLAGCDKDEPTPDSILGTWKLREVYVDPGDGSGTFQPTDYARTITFFPDSTYTTDQTICNIGNHPADGGGSGVYSPGRQLIFPTTCRINAEYPYDIAGRQLTVTYFCIEGCAERYTKVRD